MIQLNIIKEIIIIINKVSHLISINKTSSLIADMKQITAIKQLQIRFKIIDYNNINHQLRDSTPIKMSMIYLLLKEYQLMMKTLDSIMMMLIQTTMTMSKNTISKCHNLLSPLLSQVTTRMGCKLIRETAIKFINLFTTMAINCLV